MYTLTYNGFTLTNDGNHTIDTLDGIARVDVRKSEDVLTGGDGGNIWQRNLAMRIISVGGWIGADSSANYVIVKQAMQAAFPITNTLTTLSITNHDGSVKTLSAKVVAIPDFKETEGENDEARYNFILQCENPYFSDSTSQGLTLTPTAFGGAPVPFPVPFPIGGLPVVGYINNTGDVLGYPSYTFSGQLVNPTITNLTTGQSFVINTTINAGSTLTAYHTNLGDFVLLDGGNAYQYFSGTFFTLVAGNNAFVISASGYDATGNVVITYTPSYSYL
jgi:hypothetical protein